MRARIEFTAALVVLAIGAATILLCATRAWQTLTTPRSRPFADDVLAVSGRTIDAAPTALALVALAGVVAVIATRGVLRRVVGALVALAGLASIWRCISAMSAVSPSRARAIVHDKHPHVVQSDALGPVVVTHPTWGVLSIIAGVLVVVAGVVIAVRGGRWAAMSARYDAPAAPGVDPEQERARADASLWTALERGEDPTVHDPNESR